MPIVSLPNGVELEFPDSMDETAMRNAIVSNFPEYAPKSSVLDRARDVGNSLAKGAYGVTEAVVGLYDLGTGGRAGKFLEEHAGYKPKEWKATLDASMTPEQQAANQKVQDAKGFTDTVATAVQNPSVIGHTIVESVPSMLAGGLAGRGIAATGKVAPWLAGAAGEGVVGAGSAAESIRQNTDDGLLTPGQSGAAVASGAGTMAFGAAGGRLAKKLGIADVDTMLAGGAANVTSKGVAQRIVAGGISEGLFEELPQSSQEKIWQNAALDKPLLDGVPEAAGMGLVTGAAMGGISAGAIQGKAGGQPEPSQPAPTIADIGSAKTIDEVIAAAADIISTPVEAKKSAQGDLLGQLEASAGVADAVGMAMPSLAENVQVATPPVDESAISNVIQQEAVRMPVDVAAPLGEVAASAGKGGALPTGQIAVEAAPAPAITGKPIDAEWSEFLPESGTLGIPRSDMPQIRAEHRGAMVNFLNARGIAHEQAEVPAANLKPTQKEFSPAKVQQAREFQGGDRSILISADNHVVDGHHQWVARLANNEPVKVIRLNAPIKDLLPQVAEFPSAQVSAGSEASDAKTLWETRTRESVRADKAAPSTLTSRTLGGNHPQGENSLAAKAREKEDWPLTSRYPVPADASGASGFAGESPNAGGIAPTVRALSGKESIAPNQKEGDSKEFMLQGGSEPTPTVTGQQSLYAGKSDAGSGQIAPNAQGQSKNSVSLDESADKPAERDDAQFFKHDPNYKLPEPFRTKSHANLFKDKNRLAAVAEETEGGWSLQMEPRALSEREKLEAMRDVSRLNNALVANGVAQVKPVHKAPSREYQLAKEVAKVFGIKVQFVSNNGTFDGVAHRGVAYLAEGMRRPALAIAGHEALHVMQQTNPELAKDLYQHIQQYLREDAVPERKLREELMSGGLVSNDYALGEVIADLSGSMWMDPRFWRDLRQKDENLFRKAAYLFMEAMTKAIESLAGTRFDAKSLVKDVNAVRKVIADAWAEHNKIRDAASARGSENLTGDEPGSSSAQPAQEALQQSATMNVKGEPKTLDPNAHSDGRMRILEDDDPNSKVLAVQTLFSRNTPDAIIGAPLGEMANHADYAAAKAGDTSAAIRLVSDVVSSEMIEKVRATIGNENPIIQPVAAIEASGKNRIPSVAAVKIAGALGLDAGAEIIQSSSPKRTALAGLDRIFKRPKFDGHVEQGRAYLLVDDTITQGGTFAALKAHIEAEGGRVIGALALTGKQYSAKMALSTDTLKKLRDQHGDIEQQFQAATGYGFDALTESEARYLASYRPTDAVRNRILSGGQPSGDGAGARSVSQADVTGSADKPKFSRTEPTDQGQSMPKETRLEAVRRVGQDKFNRFKILQSEIELLAARKTGYQGEDIHEARAFMDDKGVHNPIRDESDVYQAETLMSGRISTRKEDFRERQMKPLIEKTYAAGLRMEQIGDFLKMQHAPEANKRAREIQGNPDATAFGISDERAKQAMNEFKALPNYDAVKSIANEWRAITEQSKKILLDAGIITQEIADAWDATYSVYVPVKGTESKGGGGKGLSVNGKQKQRLGHSERDEAILENILRDHERAISNEETNNVGMTLIRFGLAAQNPEIMTIDKPAKRQVLKDATAFEVQYNGNFVAAFSDKASAEAFKAKDALKNSRSMQDYAIEKTTNPYVALMTSPMLAENEVTVYVAGHAVRVQINDEIAARAYTNMGVESLGAILSVGREVNGWLSKAYTGYSPDFILTNPIRDAIQGAITLTGEHGAGMAAKIYANYPLAVKELVKHFREPGKSKLVTEYRAAGGSTGAAYLADLERIGNDIMAAYNECAGPIATYRRVYAEKVAGGAGAGKAGTYAALKAGTAGFRKLPMIGHFLSLMERINSVTENALRVATFKTLVDNGVSRPKAAAQAKNLMNFNRRGEISNQAGALFLFFNPSVQGSSLLVDSLATSKHKNQARALAGMMTLAAIALAEAARGGGEEDERKWKQTPNSVKDRNWVVGFGDYQFMLPLPYGYAAFHMLGNVISDYMHGEDGHKLGIRVASGVFGNFSPVGNPWEGQSPVFSVSPTLLKLAGGPGMNENSFGQQIAPKRWDDAKPDSQLMNRKTKGTLYADVAEKVNELTGGSKYERGAIDVSPETLRYWVQALTGGAGQFAIDSINVPSMAAQGVSPAPKDLPVVRRFVREITVSDARSAFWEKANEVKAAADAFAAARKAGDGAAARAIMSENKALISLADYARETQKMVKARRDQADKIRMDETIPLATKHERMKLIEMKEAAIYQRFLDSLDKRTKAAEDAKKEKSGG